MVDSLFLELISSFLLAIILVIIEDCWPRFVNEYWPRFVYEYWPRIFDNWLAILAILVTIRVTILGARIFMALLFILLDTIFRIIVIIFIVNITAYIIDTFINEYLLPTLKTAGKIVIQIFIITGWLFFIYVVLCILEYIYKYIHMYL